jgi:hypothetical protein
VRRTGWRATPAHCVSTLLAVVLATVVGWHACDAGGAWRTPATIAAAVRANSVAPSATDAPAPTRLAPAHTGLPAPAGPGSALSARTFLPAVDQVGRLARAFADGRAAGTTFSSIRSRAPPHPSW